MVLLDSVQKLNLRFNSFKLLNSRPCSHSYGGFVMFISLICVILDWSYYSLNWDYKMNMTQTIKYSTSNRIQYFPTFFQPQDIIEQTYTMWPNAYISFQNDALHASTMWSTLVCSIVLTTVLHQYIFPLHLYSPSFTYLTCTSRIQVNYKWL